MVCKYKFLHQLNTNDYDLLVLDKIQELVSCKQIYDGI